MGQYCAIATIFQRKGGEIFDNSNSDNRHLNIMCTILSTRNCTLDFTAALLHEPDWSRRWFNGSKELFTQFNPVHPVTCVPFFVFWKLCVCSSLKLWARELLFQFEWVSHQPVSRRHQQWRPCSNPALLRSSSFSASPSPFASRVFWLLLPVWSPAVAAGLWREKLLMWSE